MQSQELRRKFLSYFQKHGHEIVPSSPVIPHDDPSLLFINAGMNQFKQVFLGRETLEYTKASTSQKCVRVGGKHNDLDNVGFTTRHLTFFEMLGNFAFGDYFKKEAIAHAWKLSTEILGLEEEKIWVSVFETDDEAFEIWREWIDESRIVRLGAKDNFWAMGDTGPCGPCSELLYDRGDAFGKGTNPYEDPDGERFFEFWNLVFMESNRDKHGKMSDLPKKNIDTGMGLERMVALKIGAKTLFETDILRSLIAEVENLSGKKYDRDDMHLAPAFHVVADHIRSLSFAIADGAQPSNTDRGYVLRKILRRAVRYGRILDLNKPFLGKVFQRLLTEMGEDFPELVEAKEKIPELLQIEEENFLRTLARGGNILQAIIDKAKEQSNKQITGEDAFRLKDTYGFPLDELMLLAKDNELEVNLDAFQILEKQAKERSRASQKNISQEASVSLFENFVARHGTSSFVGYEKTEHEATILGILKEKTFVEEIEAGEEAWIILDKTPFYAEMGGQAGDHGMIKHQGAKFEVYDCISPFTDVVAHKGKLVDGGLLVGEPVHAIVNKARRNLIRNNHTATHLLHWALCNVLGDHIKQAGSLVEEDRLRFDFNHHKGLTKEEIRAIEKLINDKVLHGSPVKISEVPYKEIQSDPHIKQFFGEKYGKTVRVVDIDGFSKELCGGTHTSSLATIGLFRIVKEGSVAAGVRRIEAVTGAAAHAHMFEKEDVLFHVADELKVSPEKILGKLHSVFDEQKKYKEQIKKLRTSHIKGLSQDLISKKTSVGSFEFITFSSSEIEKEDAMLLAEELLLHLQNGVVLIGVTGPGHIQLQLRISASLVQKGFKASTWMQEISPHVEGRGGGKPDGAMAGGKNPAGFDKAVNALKEILYHS